MRKKTSKTAGASNLGHATAVPSFNWREFDPAMLNGKGDLAVELTAYRDHLDTLLKDRGKYVLIKGPEVIGIYRAHKAAMEVAFRFAPGPVLVKKIVEEEPVLEIGHVVP